MNLTSYILMAMLYFSPLHKNALIEDPSTRLNRYQKMAQDITEVVSDPAEDPLFKEKYGRAKTALLLVSMAKHESNYDEAVDNGKKRGPGGSVCFLQVMPNMKNTKYYFTEQYLLSDRKNCIRAALKVIRETKCSDSLNDMMRSYVSGICNKHPDPATEKRISKYAYGETMWYLGFIRLYPVKAYVKE